MWPARRSCLRVCMADGCYPSTRKTALRFRSNCSSTKVQARIEVKSGGRYRPALRGTIAVIAQADSTFKITQDQITILQADSHEQDGLFSCSATIVPATLHYEISPDGGTMVLSPPARRRLFLPESASPGCRTSAAGGNGSLELARRSVTGSVSRFAQPSVGKI